MVSSVSEKLPLLLAPSFPESNGCRLLCVQLSSQPSSPRGVALPSDFVVHLDEPWPSAYPHETFGCLLMFCSALSYGVMQLLLHLATDYQAFPAATVAALQGVVLIIFSLTSILSFKDTRAQVMRTPLTDLPLVALRGFLGGMGANLLIASLSLIPLGTTASLLCLNPIIAIAMSSVILGEVFGALELTAALVCFVGVALVSNPTLEINLSLLGHSDYVSGCILAILASCSVAAAYVTVKSYAKRVHYLVSVLSVGIWAFLMGIAMGGADPGPLLQNSMHTTVVVVGCVFGVLAQCFLNKAFEYCRAGMGAVILNADVPISYLLGVLFLGELPSFVGIFGSVLVTIGALLVTSKELIFR